MSLNFKVMSPTHYHHRHHHAVMFLTFLTLRLVRSVRAVVSSVTLQLLGDTTFVPAGKLSWFTFY